MSDLNEIFKRSVHAQQAGRLREAIEGYLQILAIDPQRFAALSNLGMALQAAGRIEEALHSFRRALAIQDNAVTRNNLGNALRVLGRLEEAIENFRSALAFNPDSAETHNNLGIALAGLGRFSEAAAHLERAIVLDPGHAPAHSNLGNALQTQGRMAEALGCYRRAIELDPGYAEAHSNLAAALVATGALDEAAAHFRQAVALRPGLGGAWRQLAELDAEAVDPEAVRRLLAGPRLSDEQRLNLHFTLGTVEDARGDFDRAFFHFAEGNRLRRGAARFDAAAHAGGVDALVSLCTREFFEQRANFGIDADEPVFIVGMPRSGTTLVEQILASHPLVQGGGELHWIPSLLRRLGGAGAGADACAAILPGIDRETSRSLGTEYLQQARAAMQGGAALRFTDKLPDNYLRLGLVRLMLPRARIIHCRRDPRDTCLSIFFQNFAGHHPYTWDLADIGACYRDYDRLMRHWRTVLPPDAMMQVQYEDLVDDLEGVCRRLLAFLGLDWDPRCLDFHRTPRLLVSASNADVRRPLYRHAVGRWRHYEKHIGELLDVLAPCLESPPAD
jgi:tetratricopeptide (TPR) repeat protein